MVTPNTISQKCKYALRAIFELALRDSPEPVKIQDIASVQAIPPRFLEIILSELKHGGFVQSRRGNNGGYMLARPANDIAVGEVIGFIQGAARQGVQPGRRRTDLMGDYIFSNLWQKVTKAVADIYNSTTFADLVQQELAQRKKYVPDYAI